MRSVVTIKNLCLKKTEGFSRSGSAGGAGGKKAGGFNPMVPNAAGGFIGDIHVGKFDDILNKFDPSVLRRVKSTVNEITFN